MATTFDPATLPATRPSDALVVVGQQADPSTADNVFLRTFQLDHLSGNRFFGDGNLAPTVSSLMTRIQSLDVSEPFRHVQQDFRGNGLYVPANGVDALALGSSTHSGSHQAIDDFMAELYDQIGKRAAQAEADYTTLKTAQLDANPNSLPADYARIETDAKTIADNLAVREHAIASNFRALAVQESGIPEAAARLSLGPDDTVLAYNNSDLRNTVGANWAEGKSADASAAFNMENIAGRIDAERLLDIDLVKLRNCPPSAPMEQSSVIA